MRYFKQSHESGEITFLMLQFFGFHEVPISIIKTSSEKIENWHARKGMIYSFDLSKIVKIKNFLIFIISNKDQSDSIVTELTTLIYYLFSKNF